MRSALSVCWVAVIGSFFPGPLLADDAALPRDWRASVRMPTVLLCTVAYDDIVFNRCVIGCKR